MSGSPRSVSVTEQMVLNGDFGNWDSSMSGGEGEDGEDAKDAEDDEEYEQGSDNSDTNQIDIAQVPDESDHSKKKFTDGEESSKKKHKALNESDNKKATDKDEDDKSLAFDDDAHALTVTKYVVQHGAHREFGVRQKFILHEAKRAMLVRDGQHIGSMLNSRSGKMWEGLKWYHVTVLGGTLTTTGKHESCPYVCFKPPDTCADSDDECWLRPIPHKVMEHWKPLWRQELKEKYIEDPDRAKRLITAYKLVLKWDDSMLTGPKLDVQQLGVGRKGMIPLVEKLKSIRVIPSTQTKGAKAGQVTGNTYLKSAISKSSSIASSSTDIFTEHSEITTVAHARTVKIGPSCTTKTFEVDGFIYATFLANA